MSAGPNTSVEHAGLSVEQVERLTREIIGRHNESSVGPVMYYTGLTLTDVNYSAGNSVVRFDKRPLGLTVDSYSCQLPNMIIRQRYEKASTIITSNRAVEEWAPLFNDKLLAGAAMDRLLHHAHVIEITGHSYRNPPLSGRGKAA